MLAPVSVLDSTGLQCTGRFICGPHLSPVDLSQCIQAPLQLSGKTSCHAVSPGSTAHVIHFYFTPSATLPGWLSLKWDQPLAAVSETLLSWMPMTIAHSKLTMSDQLFQAQFTKVLTVSSGFYTHFWKQAWSWRVLCLGMKCLSNYPVTLW